MYFPSDFFLTASILQARVYGVEEVVGVKAVIDEVLTDDQCLCRVCVYYIGINYDIRKEQNK